MKFHSRNMLAAAIALASQSAFSADTYLNVFLDSAPMQGLEVKLDGEVLGVTNLQGAASSFTPAGDHTIQLYRDGAFLTELNYNTAKDQDAEISVTFTEKRSKPDVKVSLYTVGDTGVKGTLVGRVLDQAGLPVAGARVSDFDVSVETVTDANGEFELNLPRGEATLSVEHNDYSNSLIENINVLADVGTTAIVKLSPKAKEQVDIAVPVFQPIEEVLTIGTYKADDTSIGLERFSNDVVDAIDVETMARFGDSNIASALTRLAGVAVTGGQYANVRGLDGRYISSTLNGFLMPSTDPLRRDIQLDLFPASILDNVQVQKTYSADRLGNTTGGAMQIETKGLPSERVGKFKIKLGGTQGITGKDIITHEGSNGDWLGFDSGLRDYSQTVVDATDGGRSLRIGDSGEEGVTDPYVAAAYAVTFEDDYNVKKKKANPDFDLGLAFGDVTDSGLLGYYAAINYKYDTSSRLDATLSDTLGTQGEYGRSKELYKLDGYFVVGSQFRSEDEILAKTIILRNSDLVTYQESGIDKEDNEVDRTYLQWTERQFLSQQVEGHHVFDVDLQNHELDWGLSYSNTDLHQPDRREYSYLSDFLILGTLERRWLDMNEDSVDIRLDYTAPIQFSSSVTTEIKVGALRSDKEREVEQYRFGWKDGAGDFGPETVTINHNLEDVFGYEQFVLDSYRINPKTANTDSFDAEENVSAVYLDTSTEIGEHFVLDVGARQQNFEQSLMYPNQPSSNANLDVESLLPAANLTFIANDAWQFKVAASQTVSYPGIVEKSLAKMYDENGDPFIGCPACTESEISNYDFRIEYYFSNEESISLALFNKEIDSPMEKAVLDASGSANSGYTFRQAESATLNGVEIDGRFNAFDNGTWLGFVSGNVSHILSEVTLDADSLRLEGEGSQGRELQGQAPWLANVQLGLDHFPTGQKVTLLLNYFDDRIDKVLRQPRKAIYEVGRAELNLNYEAMIGDAYTVKVQFKNLMDAAFEKRINDQIVESYREGISYSAEFAWEF